MGTSVVIDDNLLAEARRLTGLKETSDVMREALRALIERESARRLARLRSPIPMIAFTPNQATRSQLAVAWGVETFLAPQVRHTDEMAQQVDEILVDCGRCAEGDMVIICAGSPPGVPGTTNALRVHRVGDALNHAWETYQSKH